MDLSSSKSAHLFLPQAELLFIPEFYGLKEANKLFDGLRTSIQWRQQQIKIFGKIYPEPRLTALYANNSKSYSYSNITMHPMKFPQEVLEIKDKIEDTAQHAFTTVLMNLYRDGNDSNGWHADNEKELGKNPVIASLSLGATRTFHFKHRRLKDEKYKLELPHGSLLLMKGEMQHNWVHRIAKTTRKVGERINMTFRTM